MPNIEKINVDVSIQLPKLQVNFFLTLINEWASVIHIFLDMS